VFTDIPRFGLRREGAPRLLQFLGCGGLGCLPFGTPGAMSYERKAGNPARAQGAGERSPARPAQSKRPIGRQPAHVEPAVVVVDDLPALVPVTRREIEVIETYLSALVEEALAGTKSKVSRRR
jgi:hypothetical protein